MGTKSTDEMVDVFYAAGKPCEHVDIRAGLAAVTPLVQRDALRNVWDALCGPGVALDAAALNEACGLVERVARDLGVEL